MEFRQLRYFIAVAQELHFGRAAEHLQITQPALSKQIRVLETELGFELFTRTKRVVQLTQAGQVFLEQAHKLLQQTEEAVKLARRTAMGEVGHLTIGFTATATYTILPELMRRFCDRFPEVAVEMLELCTEDQVRALNLGQIDLAFLHPPIDSRGLELYPILEEEFVAVFPRTFPLLEKEYLSLKALDGASFILHPRQEGPVLYDGFIHLCQQLGFQPQIVKEVCSHQTRICLVAAGMGITFIPAGLQTLVSKDVVCRPLKDCPIKLQFAAAWRSNSTAPVLQELLKVMQVLV